MLEKNPNDAIHSRSFSLRGLDPHRALVREAMPAVVLACVLLAAVFWVVPGRSRNPLAETTVWALLVSTSFVGWGSLVRLVVAPRERVDVGLRALWGGSLLCFVGGALMIFSLMVRLTALVLVEIGVGLALVALVRERAAVHRRVRFARRFLRREPALSAVGFVVAGLVAVYCLGGIADWHTNPYDDDIAYLAFLKKLSDTGTLLEPFSFRRLSAYGGQTFFLELVSVRAAPSQAHTWDRCVCVLLIVLLALGHRTRGRRPNFLFLSATIAMLVLVPSIAINTASYFSGVLFCLGLFRTIVWVEETAGEHRGERRLASWKAAFPIALVAASVCTLRQSYLPVPVVVLAVSYCVRLRRTKGTLRERIAEPLLAAGFALVFLLPWFIVSHLSNQTFLYPLMPGTFHVPLALNASGWNAIREIAFQVNVAVECMPLESLGLFFIAAAFVREPSSRMALGATCIGAIIGLVTVVHGLTQSDPKNIGRYAFAFLFSMVMAVALTTGTSRLTTKLGRREIAAGIVLFALLWELVSSRAQFWKEYGLKFNNIELLAYARSRTRETEPPERRMYVDRLQAAIPAGERIAVLVDEPYHLDFRRNPIWNLDMPGFASLPPGMPSFQGSEALEQYFRGLGVRWLMYVTPEHSRYHYRRDYFLGLFVEEQELWRTYAPYVVDFIDNMTAIHARHREAYSERGIVVIDLAEPRGAPAASTPEVDPIQVQPTKDKDSEPPSVKGTEPEEGTEPETRDR